MIQVVVPESLSMVESHSSPERAFVERAQPHSWFQVADELHSQAVHLYNQRGRRTRSFSDFRTGERITWDAVNRTAFLLAGFALENAIKAFLVYENPSWISNGRLSGRLRSHQLCALAQGSKHIPHKLRGRSVLRAFESGLESWARYPCSVSIEMDREQTLLTETLWTKYLVLSSSYGRRLKNLLSRSWAGPHGQIYRYKITGDYLARR